LQTNVREKIKTNISCSITFLKLCHLWGNAEKIL